MRAPIRQVISPAGAALGQPRHCGFAVKYDNAVAAGATLVIVAQNSAAAPITMGGRAGRADDRSGDHDLAGRRQRDQGAAQRADRGHRQPRAGRADARRWPQRRRRRADPRARAASSSPSPTSRRPARTSCRCRRVTPAPPPDATSGPERLRPGQPEAHAVGTSMAAPHIAGVMALLRQAHPTYSVEQLKALAVNGSLHDVFVGDGGTGLRFGPALAGAGRVDVVNTLTSPVAAFAGDDPGAVSVTFDGEIVGTVTQTRRVTVRNFGATPQTYDLGIDLVTDADGVSFSVPAQVTVPAGSSATFNVQMDANAAAMKRSRDPTAPAVVGGLPRQWLTEESGVITLSQGATLKLRVPVYAAVHPAARTTASALLPAGPAGAASIVLGGTGVCTGTLSGSTCTATSSDFVSLVTPVELQGVNPINPALNPRSNLRYAGVVFDAGRSGVEVRRGDLGRPHELRDTEFDALHRHQRRRHRRLGAVQRHADRRARHARQLRAAVADGCGQHAGFPELHRVEHRRYGRLPEQPGSAAALPGRHRHERDGADVQVQGRRLRQPHRGLRDHRPVHLHRRRFHRAGRPAAGSSRCDLPGDGESGGRRRERIPGGPVAPPSQCRRRARRGGDSGAIADVDQRADVQCVGRGRRHGVR